MTFESSRYHISSDVFGDKIIDCSSFCRYRVITSFNVRTKNKNGLLYSISTMFGQTVQVNHFKNNCCSLAELLIKTATYKSRG